MTQQLFKRRPVSPLPGPARGQKPGEAAGQSSFAATELVATENEADVDTLPPDSLPDLEADTLPVPLAERAAAHNPNSPKIGRYELKAVLGQGGRGQVYEAFDPILRRTVAVKTLQFEVDMQSREALDAMILEARALAGLSHPHIVTVHDAGKSTRGVYIAMERLYGRDLRQRLAEGWQPTQAQAALLVRRVADALAYAHNRGVVHCDVKPANIFLNERDNPKLLDFGIARAAQIGTLPDTGAAVIGSPHYLAPEQLLGGRVDKRTDIHALGVVLYELLTLRKAFAGESVEEIAQAVLSSAPAAAFEARTGVSRALSGIAAKAMARDPDQRYGSAQALSRDLRRWLAQHAKTQAAPLESTQAPSQLTPGARRRQRQRQALRKRLSLAVLALLLSAGGALAVWPAHLDELWARLHELGTQTRPGNPAVTP